MVFLNCRNELLSLAIVLTYDSMENCGIRTDSTMLQEISHGLPHKKKLA